LGSKFGDDGDDTLIDGDDDVIIDADGGDIIIKDGGTTIGQFTNSSSDFVIQSSVQDKDIIFKGDDGGSAVTALTLDMSDSGKAIFNGDIGIGEYIYHNGDADTWIRFSDDDITVKAGGKAFLTLEEKSSAPHELTINDGSNNIDFVVKGNGSNEGNPLFKCDASTGRVGINGVGSPDCELHVDGDVKVVGDDPRIKIDGDTDSHPGLELYENGTRKWIVYNDYGNDNLTFKTNTTDLLEIEQGGDVNILAGALTCNGGVIVDNITIDGTEIDLSSGDLILDVAGDIVLDADGGDIIFKDGGTALMSIHNSSSDVSFQPQVSGKKLLFTTQAGNVAANVDSTLDSFGIFRKFILGAEAAVTSDATLSATDPVSLVVAGSGNVTGTLADAAGTGYIKIVIGLTTGAGSPKVAYKNISGSEITKTLTVGTGLILYSIDVGGGSVRWMTLGDVS